MQRLSLILTVGLVGACAGDPSVIEIEIAPSVISSLDGTATVSAIVAADSTPLDGEPVHLEIAYTDRNGIAHAIAPVDGKTDARGVFTATLTGLTWDGIGTVTATSGMLAGEATFSVLDRTPPKIEILSPTTDKHVGPGLPIDIQVHVTDEIGVSQVTLDSNGDIIGVRTTVVANGAQDKTLTFRANIPLGATPGPTIDLHALASDLSGNLAAATTMTLTVDPSITIATPPGLTGTLLADGTQAALNDPRAIALSPKDGKLYVADRSGGACANHCIVQVDATTGTVDATPVMIGVGVIEGIAFDTTGDNLYYTDRQDRTGRLTWNGGAYATPVLCNNSGGNFPQSPYHLVFDATLGLLVADGNSQELVQIATCLPTTNGTTFTNNANFDAPRGVAMDPNGQIYVSDNNRDRVSKIDPTTKVATPFSGDFREPYGLEWLAGGTTQFADSLLVAVSGDRIVTSAKQGSELAVAYLRNAPIDLAYAAGTLYILTSPGANNRGRIYKVTGF